MHTRPRIRYSQVVLTQGSGSCVGERCMHQPPLEQVATAGAPLAGNAITTYMQMRIALHIAVKPASAGTGFQQCHPPNWLDAEGGNPAPSNPYCSRCVSGGEWCKGCRSCGGSRS